MINSNRDIMVLLRSEGITDKELAGLHRVLHTIDSPEQFCLAHELVDRNRVTANHKKLLKETRHFFLRPFRFLINKN